MADLYYKGAMFQHDAMTKFFFEYVCGKDTVDMGFCSQFMTYSLYGEDKEQFNEVGAFGCKVSLNIQ
jgi:hypothetical protein